MGQWLYRCFTKTYSKNLLTKWSEMLTIGASSFWWVLMALPSSDKGVMEGLGVKNRHPFRENE